MKISKKLISLILVAVMTVSSMSFVLADETVKETCGEKELGLINALKISDWEAQDLANTVTRGEFYTILCKMQALPGTKGNEKVFSDVEPSAKFAPYVRTLAKLGLISSKDGNIYPDAPIKASEAEKLIVNALGYSPRAEIQGYSYVASRLELYEGIDHAISGELTAGDAVVMVYNALRADLMIQVVKPGSSPEYRVEEGTNLLGTAFGIYIAEGVVEGVDITRVKGENDVRPYHFEIDGLSLNIGFTENPYSYLGYEVEAYWKDIRNFEPTVMYIEKTHVNEEIVVDTEDIASIEKGKLEAYTSNGKKTDSYKLKNAIPVVYNGTATGKPLSEEMIDGKYGSVKLLDNNGNGTYDIAFVDIYENYVVSYTDAEESVIYDKFDTSKTVCLDNTLDDPYVTVYDSTGKEVSVASAVKNNVVSVYSSMDDSYQTYVRAYISDTVVSGEVESTELSSNIIVVNGKEYKLSDSIIARFGSVAVPGAQVTMSLDARGKVASIESGAMDAYKLGYLIGSDTEGVLDKTIQFKLYTADGEFVVLNGAENIYIDGIKYKNTDSEIAAVLHNVSVIFFGEDTLGTSKANVIRYAVNGAGELYSIDTPVNGKTGALALREDNQTTKDALFGVKAEGMNTTDKRYRRSGHHHTIGPKVAFTSTAKGISAPSGMVENYLDEDLYEAALAMNILSHNDIYDNVWAFYDNHKKASSEFVVLFDNNKVGEAQENIKFSLIEQCSVVMAEDGTEKDAITIITADGKLKLIAKENCKVVATANETMTVKDLKKGDIILYAQNPKGEVTSVTLWYRSETGTSVQGLSSSRWDPRSVRVGYVYKKFEDGFLMYFADNLKNIDSITAADCEYVVNTGATPTYFMYQKYDDGRSKITESDAAAIKSYEDTGADANKILLHTNYGKPITVVIFE